VIKLLRYQLFFFVIAFTNFGVAQTLVTIGTGSGVQVNHPFTRNYNYGWSKQIYLKSEINTSGSITAIAFENTVGSVTTWSNQTIYMRHNSSSTCSTSRPTASELSTSWTLVFSGSINYNSAYKTITLSTPFNFNNVDNLEIYYLNFQGTNSTNGPEFRETTGASRSVYYRVDNLTTFNANTVGTADDITNIKLSITPNCLDPTSAGTITNAQSSCGSFNPTTITSSVLPSGHTGTLEYKWQQSTTSSSAGFNDITSTNTATYDPATITQTTWYKRLSRVTCSADWSGAIESNVIEMTVNSSITISTNPVNDTVYINSCGFATFNVSLSSGNSPGYQWQVSTDNGSFWSSLVNSSIYSGVATTQLKVNASSNTFNGYLYRCVVTNLCGSATSGSARSAVISWTKNIVINEIMIQPPSNNCHADQALLIKSNYTQAGPPMECDGVSVTTSSGKEWVELYNPYCSAIDVSNWFIATRSSLSQSHGVFRIPAGTSISANGFLTIGGAASSASLKLNAFSASNVLTENSLRFYLDNNDGWLGLYGPEGNPVDAVFWTFSAGESSKWGTDSDISFAPTLIPSGSSGAPLVTDSLPGPKSVCLSAVKDYIGVVTNSKTLERSIDGAGSWQVSDNSGGASLGTTNNVAQTCTSLPIELLSFDAQLENKATHLTWETASERNNDFFAVERSPNGIDWDVLELIDGAGSSAELLSYETYDNYPLKVISYYRLKQTDFDGKARYSAIKSISNTEDLMVLPNPGNGIFYVSGLSERKENQVLVMDVTGKTIANYKTEDAMLQMNLEDHPAGIYYVKVNEEFTMKIVKWAND
jgi:hypothetical protein